LRLHRVREAMDGARVLRARQRTSAYDYAVVIINTIIGAAIALAGSFGIEALRSWQKRVAGWQEMQVAAITELQELLCTVKDELAHGEPVSPGEASSQAPTKSALERFAPRTRARMLCSRLDDQKLRKNISTFLADLKNDEASWRKDPEAWLNDQKQFTMYCNDLSDRLRTYRP